MSFQIYDNIDQFQTSDSDSESSKKNFSHSKRLKKSSDLKRKENSRNKDDKKNLKVGEANEKQTTSKNIATNCEIKRKQNSPPKQTNPILSNKLLKSSNLPKEKEANSKTNNLVKKALDDEEVSFDEKTSEDNSESEYNKNDTNFVSNEDSDQNKIDISSDENDVKSVEIHTIQKKDEGDKSCANCHMYKKKIAILRSKI